MNDEKLKILKMIAEGKVKPEEGLELLNSLENVEEKIKPSRWLRIKVWENEDGREVDSSKKPKVNVNLPLGLAKTVLKMIPEKAKEKMNFNLGDDTSLSLEDLNLQELIDAIKSYGPLTLVEVNDEDTKVLITLE